MTEPALKEQSDRPAAESAPVVVTQGLTYRDLQRGIFLAAALFLIYHLAEPLTTLLLFFLLVFILAAVLNPVVVRLERRGVPRIISALGVVLAVLGAFVLLAWLALPPLLDEISKFAATFGQRQGRLGEIYAEFQVKYPAIAAQIPPPEQLATTVTRNAGALMGQVGRYAGNVAVGMFSMLLLMVLVVFTAAHPEPLVVGLLGATPERHRPRMESALKRILEQLKNWAFGSLILGVLIGVIVGVGLRILGVPYAFLFGVIAGVGELVPNIGPVISAVPPAVMALASDPALAVKVLVLFIVVQLLENNFIVPLVMGQSLNLHPVSVTFTVLVMGALFGLLGAVLAVPVCAIIKVCWEEFHLEPSQINGELLLQRAREIVREGSPNPRDRTPLAEAGKRRDRRERQAETRTGEEPGAAKDSGKPRRGGWNQRRRPR